MSKTISEIVRDVEKNYTQGTTKIGKYVDWSMYETVERIDAYLNSKHISGESDSLGRPKPFFNIVTAAVNIWYRATDIDRKDIRVTPDKIANTGLAFIATVHLHKWMKKSKFGVFLNEWGRTLAKYGSAVVKFVEKDGELTAQVIPWNKFISDPVDFDAAPRIEKFYKTKEQLYKMVKENGYDKAKVESLCTGLESRKNLDGSKQDSQSNFIELYEVHGELSKADYLRSKGEEPEDGDEDVYFQQMHVVSFMADEKGEFKDYTLYSGREKKDPYMITHLIKEDGRTLSIGAVEYLFDAQWMQNHTVKNIKDTLDIASKLIFQTSDTNYVGRNILNAIETGDIFTHAAGMPLTRVANDKPDISALQNFGTMWRNLAPELTSTPEAMRGITPPSGQPYSTTALLAQQGNSLFEIMTENKGLAIEEMFREFVLPYIKKKMDTKEEIVATLTDQEIAEIDSMYVPREAAKRFNSEAVEKTIAFLESDKQEDAPVPYDPSAREADIKKQLAMTGNKRSFTPDDVGEKTWKEALEGFEWDINVEVTNESTDKMQSLQTLNTALQTIASNPMVLQDPNAKMLFSAILTETGRISPLQIQNTSIATPTAAPPGA